MNRTNRTNMSAVSLLSTNFQLVSWFRPFDLSGKNRRGVRSNTQDKDPTRDITCCHSWVRVTHEPRLTFDAGNKPPMKKLRQRTLISAILLTATTCGVAIQTTTPAAAQGDRKST